MFCHGIWSTGRLVRLFLLFAHLLLESWCFCFIKLETWGSKVSSPCLLSLKQIFFPVNPSYCILSYESFSLSSVRILQSFVEFFFPLVHI